MFSDLTWTPINTNTLTADQPSCWLDIVGGTVGLINYPALFIAFDDSNLYFRMRLDCTPIDPEEPTVKLFKNNIWGVLIKDTALNTQYTARVNSKQNDEAIEVYTASATDPFILLACSEDIVYGNAGNVQVIPTNDSSNFNGNTDYFLDFKVSLDCFPEGFFQSNHVYCGFTSATDQGINKEIPPPYGPGNPPQNNPNLCSGIPTVDVTKDVTPKTGKTCSSQSTTYTISITVTNTSSLPLNITVNDVITSEFVPTIPIPAPPPWTTTLNSGDSETFEYQVTGYFLNIGSYSFNTATVIDPVTQVEFGRVEGPTITVINCRGLIFS
jgi:hypothetical protein